MKHFGFGHRLVAATVAAICASTLTATSATAQPLSPDTPRAKPGERYGATPSDNWPPTPITSVHDLGKVRYGKDTDYCLASLTKYSIDYPSLRKCTGGLEDYWHRTNFPNKYNGSIGLVNLTGSNDLDPNDPNSVLGERRRCLTRHMYRAAFRPCDVKNTWQYWRFENDHLVLARMPEYCLSGIPKEWLMYLERCDSRPSAPHRQHWRWSAATEPENHFDPIPLLPLVDIP